MNEKDREIRKRVLEIQYDFGYNGDKHTELWRRPASLGVGQER